VEWGYAAAGDDENNWTTVDKSVLSDAPDGIEKMIGFEGKPDPTTGFYCVRDVESVRVHLLSFLILCRLKCFLLLFSCFTLAYTLFQVYNEGKLVTSEADLKNSFQKPSSKKLG